MTEVLNAVVDVILGCMIYYTYCRLEKAEQLAHENAARINILQIRVGNYASCVANQPDDRRN